MKALMKFIRGHRLLAIIGVSVVVALLWSHAAWADTPTQGGTSPDAGLLDKIMKSYLTSAKTWEAKVRAIANNMFYLGAVISLGWTGIRMALKPKEFDGIFSTVVKQVFTLSFFYMLVSQGSYFSGLIISGFEQAGMDTSGSGALSPSSIVTLGFDCLFRIFDAIGSMGWGDTAAFGLPLAFAGVTILLCFTAVAVLFLLVTIEAYFVMYGGIIMLGFGALPWTRDIPKNYLVYAINVGVRIFVLYLVVSVGLTMAKDWPGMVNAGTADNVMHNAFYIVVAAVVFAAVAWKVPGIAAALTSGSVNMSASDGIAVGAAAMGMAGGAVGLGMAAAKTAGGAAMSTIRGAAQAGIAGTQLAREMGASGSGAVVKGIGNAIGAAGSEASRSMGAKLGLKTASPNATDASGDRIGNLGTRAANNLADKTQAAREGNAAKPVADTAKAASGSDAAKPAANAEQPAATNAGTGTADVADASQQGTGESGSAASAAASAPPPAPSEEGNAVAAEAANSDVRSIKPPSATPVEPPSVGANAGPSAVTGNAASSSGGNAPAPAPAGAPAPEKHTAKPDGGNGRSLGDALSNLSPPSMPHDGGGGGVQVNLHGGHED